MSKLKVLSSLPLERENSRAILGGKKIHKKQKILAIEMTAAIQVVLVPPKFFSLSKISPFNGNAELNFWLFNVTGRSSLLSQSSVSKTSQVSEAVP